MGRLAMFTLVLGLIAGAVGGSVLSTVRASADEDSALQPGSQEAARPRTAYVKFLKLIQGDPVLTQRQIELNRDLEFELRRLAENYTSALEEKRSLCDRHKPDTQPYRDAFEELIRLEGELYEKQLRLEADIQAELKTAAIESFGDIRELVSEVGRSLGYTQVLNISDPSSRQTDLDQDFEALQKELLVSPVLVYDDAHDITEIALKEIKLKRGNNLALAAVYAVNDAGQRLERLPASAETNPDEIAYEVRLGQKLILKTEVTDLDGEGKTIPAKAKDARVDWWLSPWKGTGEIGEEGVYAAPETMPESGDVIRINVSVVKARDKRETLKIRLLPKE